jgi:hypothetical protein
MVYTKEQLQNIILPMVRSLPPGEDAHAVALTNSIVKLILEDRQANQNALLKTPVDGVTAVNTGEISDGYHTFNELYEYRKLFNAGWFNELFRHYQNYNVHKSKKHADGKECFDGGRFIVVADLPTGQISNHYELKDWDLFDIEERETAARWDGHSPAEVAKRITKYLEETAKWGRK